MTPRSAFLNESLAEYVEAHSSGPDEVQRELIAATADLGKASVMQIGASQGAFMTMLTTVLQPRFAVGGGHVHRLFGARCGQGPSGWRTALVL